MTAAVSAARGNDGSGGGPGVTAGMTASELTAVLAEDHWRIDRICTELELGQGSPENRKDLADHLIAEIVRHAVAEEPHLPADDDLTEADHLMRLLEGAGPQEIRFERLLSALIRAIRRHIRAEGPAARQLRSTCSPEQLRELGQAVLDSRDTAPSLPHPALSDRMPASDVLRPGPGFVDRARAALSR